MSSCHPTVCNSKESIDNWYELYIYLFINGNQFYTTNIKKCGIVLKLKLNINEYGVLIYSFFKIG